MVQVPLSLAVAPALLLPLTFTEALLIALPDAVSVTVITYCFFCAKAMEESRIKKMTEVSFLMLERIYFG
jgi:hypothetical protein